jgi:hypothetical protein
MERAAGAHLERQTSPSRLRIILRQEILPEPPINDDRLAELADEDVRGLEIAVDHALAVGICDGLGGGAHVRQER